MPNMTSRFGLPLLTAGQAQKDVTYNEAMALVDALITPIVESIAPSTIPISPAPGQCWVVGALPTGAWLGFSNALACWTEGGWRFANAVVGMSVWNRDDAMIAHFEAGAWRKGAPNANGYYVQGQQVIGARLPAISNPTGGTTSDIEARIAISAVLSALRAHGLVAP
jgi:hypothetical protein